MSRIWHVQTATLPMVIRYAGVGFVGRFPPLPGCVARGLSYDETVLNLAREIVRTLEKGGTDGPRIE